jgi:hypothetical protein
MRAFMAYDSVHAHSVECEWIRIFHGKMVRIFLYQRVDAILFIKNIFHLIFSRDEQSNSFKKNLKPCNLFF